MIKRKDLERAYWGPNRLPCEWKSIRQIAKETKLDPAYIAKALDGYSIPIRAPSVDAHKRLWEMLVERFHMIPEVHFLYQTAINMKPVDFYIVNESIGILVNFSLPIYEIQTIHIGNSMIVKVGCSDLEKMVDGLEKQLRDLKVLNRYVDETDQDSEGW